MSRKKLIAGGIILLAVIVSYVSIASGPSSQIGSGGKDTIGVIPIEGEILGGNQDILSDSAGSEEIMNQIREASKDPSVKAVVLRINSPGGGVAATQEIAREIEKLKATGKPVIASMGDTAASGGYWLSAMADKIYANPGTLTGSIGVRMDTQNLEELYKKLGIGFEVIKSGPYKDMGSTSRQLKPEERKILQDMVDEIFGEFVDVVAQGRNLPRAQVEKLATGRVFTGKQAKEAKLVDELGNYYDAVQGAARMAGIKGEPSIKVFGNTNVWSSFFEGKGSLSGLLRYLLVSDSLTSQQQNAPSLLDLK